MRFGWLTLAHSGSPETDYAAIQDLVAQACFAETAGFDGLRLPELRPRPHQRPHPPVWRSVSSGGSLRECGRLGAPIMMARIPLARVPERLAAYQAGLAESGLDAERQQKLREQAALWRFVHVAESQAQAEDELTQALLQTRRHMVHAREANNPAAFQVEATSV